MAIAEFVKNIHELTASATKLGADEERYAIVNLIEAHKRDIGKTAGGFLAVCVCGAAFDAIEDHYLDLIKERNSHLA